MVLIIWLIYIGVSGYGVTGLRIDMKTSYLITEEAKIKGYLDR